MEYETNASVFANVKFTPVKGKLHFTSGVPTLQFSVPILRCKGFQSTREFSMSLSNPAGCGLGLYLRDARVKILGRCVFPTDRFAIETAATRRG